MNSRQSTESNELKVSQKMFQEPAHNWENDRSILSEPEISLKATIKIENEIKRAFNFDWLIMSLSAQWDNFVYSSDITKNNMRQISKSCISKRRRFSKNDKIKSLALHLVYKYVCLKCCDENCNSYDRPSLVKIKSNLTFFSLFSTFAQNF